MHEHIGNTYTQCRLYIVNCFSSAIFFSKSENIVKFRTTENNVLRSQKDPIRCAREDDTNAAIQARRKNRRSWIKRRLLNCWNHSAKTKHEPLAILFCVTTSVQIGSDRTMARSGLEYLKISTAELPAYGAQSCREGRRAIRRRTCPGDLNNRLNL